MFAILDYRKLILSASSEHVKNFFLSPERHKMYIYVICNLFCTGQNCVVNTPVICTTRKIFQA